MKEDKSLDEMEDVYRKRSYGGESIGFGHKPGVAVVDFQLGFTDARFPLGGAPLVERAVSNSMRLLAVARDCTDSYLLYRVQLEAGYALLENLCAR